MSIDIKSMINKQDYKIKLQSSNSIILKKLYLKNINYDQLGLT